LGDGWGEDVSRTLPGFVAATALAMGGCVLPPSEAVDRGIIDGTLTHDHPAVAALLVDEGAGLCTVTLVDVDAVLTAGHCAALGTPGHDDLVLFGESLWGTGETFRVVDKAVHPEYDPDGPAHDLALLFLDGLPSTEPLPLNALEMDSTWEGETVRLVGFGTDDSYYGDTAGWKRMAEGEIHDVYGDKMYHRSDEHGICAGDSGGPALMKLDGEWTLLGAASYVFPLSGGQDPCGGQGVHMRVDAHLDWLGEHIDAPELVAAPEWEPDDDGLDTCQCRAGGASGAVGLGTLGVLAGLGWLGRRRGNRG